MIYLVIALAILFGWIPLLWLLYVIGILYEKGGWWRVFIPVAWSAAKLDVAMNYTLFALFLWSRPQKGEVTISKHLKRLVWLEGPKGDFCIWVSRKWINPYDKVGIHIPLPPGR